MTQGKSKTTGTWSIVVKLGTVASIAMTVIVELTPGSPVQMILGMIVVCFLFAWASEGIPGVR